MFFSLEVAPQITFVVSAASIGATQKTVEALRNNSMTRQQAYFFWTTVRNASEYLMDVEPVGSC